MTKDKPLLWIGWMLLVTWSSLAFADNELYIQQTGNNFDFTAEQKGADNLITGLTTTDALITGADNVLNIQQGYKGNNTLNLYVNGASNNVTLMQEHFSSGYDTDSYGHHDAIINLTGSYNSVEVVQRNNNSSTVGHRSEVVIMGGSYNDITTLQTGTGDGGTVGHESLVTIRTNRDDNTVDVFQNSDYADHRSVVSVYSEGNTIDINQTGTSQNNAYVLFSANSTGPTNFTLTQNGGDVYGNPSGAYVTQTCYNTGGCTVTITQQ